MVLISGHGCGRYLIAFFSLLPFILLFYFLLIIFFISFFPQFFFSFLGFFFLACLANYMLPASYFLLFRLYGCFFFPCFCVCVCVCVLLYTIIPLNEFLLSRDIVFWWIGKTNIDYSFESGLLPCVLPEL